MRGDGWGKAWSGDCRGNFSLGVFIAEMFLRITQVK